MSGHVDADRILDAFLAPDHDRLADRVLEAALLDIARTPQRRALRVPWRYQTVNVLPRSRSLLIVAVLVVAAAGGTYLLAGNKGDPHPSEGPTAQPSPATTPSPTAAAPRDIPEGLLAAGTYRLRPFAGGTMTVDATVPGGGWAGGPPIAISGPVGESNGPNGLAVAFFNAQNLHSDPCHWDRDGTGSAPQEGDIAVGPTVDDLAAALTGNSAYESTTPVAVILGGYPAKRLELQLVPDPAGCDSYDGAGNQYFVFGGRDGSQYAQGDANTWQVTIADVEGARLIAVVISYAETSSEDLTAAQAILDSVVITP